MQSTLTALSLTVAVLFTSPALAQTRDSGDPELASIHLEGNVATGLYVTAPILMAGSVAILFAAVGRDDAAKTAVYGLSLTSLIVGVLCLTIGIGLDVDSASRYGGWASRHRAGLRLTDGPGDVGLGAAWDF